MEEEDGVELLQRYRRDRLILLDFILSGSLIKKVVMPPGAVSLDDVDLNEVSVDYVLDCAKKGGMLELSEAIRYYHDNSMFPNMNNSGAMDEFFLVTRPEFSGSPPKRSPPMVPSFTPVHIKTGLSMSASFNSNDVGDVEESHDFTHTQESTPKKERELTVDDIDDFEDEDDLEEVQSRRTSRRVPTDAFEFVLALPPFATGITDDDLRETAYEVLLSAAGAAGGLIIPVKEKKKEKRSRFIKKLGLNKSEHGSQSHPGTGLVGLLDTIRVHMEISEGMNIRTRQGLLNAMAGKIGKRMDTLLVPLELLFCISRNEFPDKKAYIRWQKRQLNMLEEGLINHPAVGFGESGRKAGELRNLLARIEESESLPSSTGEVQRTECLRSLKETAIPLAERPARGDLTGEVCHWADGYHLNVRLYEKLLSCVFDVLDEGKLTEEVEEILELLKSTWRILGITETIHYACYTWVLFHQFVITRDRGMLRHAIEQLKKIPLKEQRGPQERLHLKSLVSKLDNDGEVGESTFLQSFLSPIQKWADKRLSDYHLHFNEALLLMEDVVTVALLSRRLLQEEHEMGLESSSDTDRDQIESYISMSIKSAFSRTLQEVEALADATNEHPLALLAEHAKKLLKIDATMFIHILSKRHPQAIVVSASLLHKLYGQKLKPFSEGIEHLTEDAVAVLPSADIFEQYVIEIIRSDCDEQAGEVYIKKLNSYKVETISGTLVLRWVNSQLGRIMNWAERAVQQEHWEPVSLQQRHGSSIVEVYRIVEETVEQFFDLKVPMRMTELNSLLRGIDNAFQIYASRIVDNLASKDDLVPPLPILTRYKRESGIKAFVKKEIRDPRTLEVKMSSNINVLTTSTLCIQLNTLYYAISQLNKLEDSIWERWTRKNPDDKLARRSLVENSRSSLHKDTLDGSRTDINASIDRICEFVGTKIVFWDLREQFIDCLYRPNVSQFRVEALVEPLDMALSQLCDIIMDPLRDRVVTALLQASLDGLHRVILDGGPLRAFCPADARLMEEDLEVLKEFFISGGDGLPRAVVENQVERVRQVIKLHSLETRELIEDLKSGSNVEKQGGKTRLGADVKTLLRILCHRNDSEASQFLKKQYKIPKSIV